MNPEIMKQPSSNRLSTSARLAPVTIATSPAGYFFLDVVLKLLSLGKIPGTEFALPRWNVHDNAVFAFVIADVNLYVLSAPVGNFCPV
jgi:hypothetical protein